MLVVSFVRISFVLGLRSACQAQGVGRLADCACRSRPALALYSVLQQQRRYRASKAWRPVAQHREPCLQPHPDRQGCPARRFGAPKRRRKWRKWSCHPRRPAWLQAMAALTEATAVPFPSAGEIRPQTQGSSSNLPLCQASCERWRKLAETGPALRSLGARL